MGRARIKLLSWLIVTVITVVFLNQTLPRDEQESIATVSGIAWSNIRQKKAVEDRSLAGSVYINDASRSTIFKERSDLVRKTCAKYGINRTKLGLSNIWYMPKKNVLFCPIPKSASTFWKRVLFAFARNQELESPFTVEYKTVYEKGRHYVIKKSDNKTDILNHSNSFVFVRHPFSRLVSGWLDKYFAAHPEFWKTGIDIIKTERGQIDVVCGHDVTFKEFVSYISKRLLSGEEVNLHFTPSFYRCDVCNIDFKYIGKYETLADDSRFIMDSYGLTNNSSFFDDFEDKSELDMINDTVEWVFKQKEDIMRCISFQCGLFRVWKRLICRGVISKEELFPYETVEAAMKLTKNEFHEYLIAAHKRRNSTEAANNRGEVLIEAFQSLNKDTFENMLEAFKLDFELFGYSKYEFLDLKAPSNPNGFYLQKCPYE